jgi:hypothetical protein
LPLHAHSSHARPLPLPQADRGLELLPRRLEGPFLPTLYQSMLTKKANAHEELGELAVAREIDAHVRRALGEGSPEVTDKCRYVPIGAGNHHALCIAPW